MMFEGVRFEWWGGKFWNLRFRAGGFGSPSDRSARCKSLMF